MPSLLAGKLRRVACALFLAATPALHGGETYFTGFEAFTAGDDTIIGTDSWTGSYAGNQFHGVMTEAQHGVTGIGKAAYVGGFNTTVTKTVSGNSVYVARPVNIDPVALNQEVVTFSTVFGIKDSTTTKRDNFEFLVYNQAGNLLAGIQFDNTTLDSSTSKPRRLIYRLSWNAATSSYQYVLTGFNFLPETLETLQCRINFKTNVWTVSLSDVPIFENVPFYTGTATKDLGSIMAKMAVASTTATTITPGDNYMLFDDYTVRTDAPSAAIAVEQPSGTALTSGSSTVDFGTSLVGTPVSKTFTIRNEGDAELSGIAATIDGAAGTDYEVTTAPPATVASGSSATFTVAFNPSASGARAAALHIASNDADSTPFDVFLTGEGQALPEIAVEQPAGTNLTDGGGGVSFGNVILGSYATKTFTVKNTGGAALIGVAVSRNGANASDFVITSAPATSVNGGAATTFTVRFTPGASGVRTAALHISSNDADENPFDITLTGAGVAVPEINVRQPAGTNLKDGVSTKSFGSVAVKSKVSKTFTIENTGSAKLKNIAVTKTGKNAKDFSISAPAKTSLLPGVSTTFKVTFKPSAKGTRTAVIHVASNDADENPFDITVTGKGVAAASSAPLAAVAARRNTDSASIASIVSDAGGKYRSLTIFRGPRSDVTADEIEVSPNLVDWFSGPSHTEVIEDSAERLRVRDATPCGDGLKRYIRVRP